MTKETQYPDYLREKALIERDGFKRIVGVDEAGRGPGAGPVVACALYVPPDQVSSLAGRVKDSKKMTKKMRDKMYSFLVTSFDYAIGIVDNKEIDRINILEATKVAMKKAISQIPDVDYALIDGNMTINDLTVPYDSIIKGDNISISIAAASVVAKVTRDRMMKELHDQYPLYGWNTNKGYLSKKHIEAIKTHGTTPYHRMSFRKVGR
ncbi:MAG: ribonuclease HII [Desulfobacterales bacterium]|nr:ribonuclease HII [Desulfobacterales bacterium]MCP4158460.1 ribonuclease HII [Deltaproteobacteria bacterium]